MNHSVAPSARRASSRARVHTTLRVMSCAATMIAPAVSAQEGIESRAVRERTASVAVDYSLETFNGAIAPWQLSSISLSQRGAVGSVIARVNHARRFGTDGLQVEADAYPRLGNGMYAYLNLGYSGASIFPAWRSGAELFSSLPRAWEASAGYRQLRFGGAPVTLITGSVGRYVGNYWFSLRPFVRPKETGTSTSASLTARRYYEDGNHYIGLRAGFGSAPGDQVAQEQLARTSSSTVGVHGSNPLGTRVLGTWSLSYDHEELAAGSFRNGTTAAAGLKWRF